MADLQMHPVDKVICPNQECGGSIAHAVTCPICGGDYAHPGSVRTVSGEDQYAASWPGRGDLTVFHFEGECGHEWEVCFGFHKGKTYAFARTFADAT